MLCLSVLCSCNNRPESYQDAVETGFSYEKAAIVLPSPSDVRLIPGGRFGSRYEGNVNYLKYQYDHYDSFMLESFASRHYAPGKLLERMWDGEYAGKWLDAATRMAVNMGDTSLLASADAFAKALAQYQQPDGYMGIKLPEDRMLNDWEQDWDLWNLWNAMIGFLTHYELRGERSSLEAASGVGKWIVKRYGPVTGKNPEFLDGNTNGGFTNAVVIGQLVRLFRHTGDKEVLDFVKQVIQHFPPLKQMLATGDPYLFHPYMLHAVLGGVANYADVSGDLHMLEMVEMVWDGLVRDHLFPTGSMGNHEDLSSGPLEDIPDGQLQETCATTEWMFLTMDLYRITGQVKYIEALERTCYNALLAAQSADGMKWCYWTPLRYSKHWFHGPTRCCFWSGPRGIARLPQLIYATKGNIIYVNFFESSHAVLQTSDGPVEILQESFFPGSGNSVLVLKSSPGWTGTLRLRIPGWATDFQVRHPGGTVQNFTDSSGYVDVPHKDSSSHEIRIGFGIPLVVEQFEGEDYCVRRGPEILSIDVRDNIDTWLGEDDLISIPAEISLKETDSFKPYSWPGPAFEYRNRRRYRVDVEDLRTDESRSVILIPYADAGNEGAAFRTIFPLATTE